MVTFTMIGQRCFTRKTIHVEHAEHVDLRRHVEGDRRAGEMQRASREVPERVLGCRHMPSGEPEHDFRNARSHPPHGVR